MLEQLLEHPYLVIAAFPVHVDHGNHPSSPWDLGTDASMPNAGFSNRYEAKSWAESLRPAP